MFFVLSDEKSPPENGAADPSGELLDDLLGELLGESRNPGAQGDDGFGEPHGEAGGTLPDAGFGPFSGGTAAPQDDFSPPEPVFAEPEPVEPLSFDSGPGLADPLSFEAGPAASAPSEPGVKVELDIEDAPFLEEEERKPPPPPAPQAKTEIAQKKQAAGKAAPPVLQRLLQNKRRLAIAAGVAVCVLLAPVILLLVTGNGAEDPALPIAEAPQAEPAPVPEPPLEPAPPAVHLFQSAPYFVETRGSDGEIRFLRCAFTLSTENRMLFVELQQKRLILRDAVYHYLSNKPLSFLSDKDQLEGMKLDLLSVMNEHVTADKLHELYFEEYVIVGK